MSSASGYPNAPGRAPPRAGEEHTYQPAVQQDEQEDDLAPLQRTPSSAPSVDIDVPQSALDLTTTFESILADPETAEARFNNPDVDVVSKRASNVLKLSQENDKLRAELLAMTERLEAAERRQQELRQKLADEKEGGSA